MLRCEDIEEANKERAFQVGVWETWERYLLTEVQGKIEYIFLNYKGYWWEKVHAHKVTNVFRGK